MKIINPLLIVLVLIALAYAGVNGAGMTVLFGLAVPYIAFVVFLLGFITKVLNWSRSPVPFRIPTTVGQGKSLPWFKQSKLDNPSGTAGVIGRMALEVLLFRSLFKNTKAEITSGGMLAYGSSKWLWLGGLVFHWSFLLILVRHLRLFLEPVPGLITLLEAGDSMFEMAFLPAFYLTDAAILLSATYLFLRRVVSPQIKYLSLPADYFAILLILAIATTGVLMRYYFRVDVVAIKDLIRGLVTFSFNVPEGIGVIFYIHLFLVSVLAVYFPFSKLMHLGGVFLSPTRNMANNNRAQRHINPWNPDVKIHTYEEYEDEFREKMKESGLPVEKE
ncbi:sulfate reduction electron transfer complex DsrMKJOP subunit DsrM [bacterium]|nr:sulfate reduction electron transfer complex DsrMKJOP subunit DsrM [bacterium]